MWAGHKGISFALGTRIETRMVIFSFVRREERGRALGFKETPDSVVVGAALTHCFCSLSKHLRGLY